MAHIDTPILPSAAPIYGKIKNLANKQFHYWTVLYFAYAKKKVAHWVCQCKCGTQRLISANALQGNRTKSCGCWSKDFPPAVMHGLCDTPEAKSYYHMRDRCTNASHPFFDDYGGRGITICDRWLNGTSIKYGLACFVEDMGTKQPRQSIDRIDNDKGYWCGHCGECVALNRTANCRWSNPMEQANNTRRNIILTWNGHSQTMAEWGRTIGISNRTLWQRLKSGWDVEKTLTTPIRHSARWHS